MNTTLIYSSLTGNTRKVAKVMAQEVGIEMKRPGELTDLEGVELLFLGSGVYANRPARSLRRFLRNLSSLAGIKVALFGTYGFRPNQLDWLAKCVGKKGGEVLGRFSCKGRSWDTLGLVGRGHPSVPELETAAAFARQISVRAEDT